MAQRTSNELSKIMLMASDMAYAANEPLFAGFGTALRSFPDTDNIGIEARYSIPSGFVVDRRFQTLNGFKAIAFRHITTADVILAFAGTDGPDKKDWTENARFGWGQWTSAKTDVLKYLNDLKGADGRTPFTGKLHFTGQSLGGGLAEYAAYEFLTSKGSAINQWKAQTTVTTFNGFGGNQVLGDVKVSEIANFDRNLLGGVSAAAAYYVANDQVSRLGNGHVGIDQYFLNYRASTINQRTGQLNYLDPVDAHRIESGLYANLSPVLQFEEARRTPNDPLVIDNLQQYAALLSAFANDRFPGLTEGKFNLGGALAAAMAIGVGATSGETRDVHTLSRALINSFDLAGAFDRSPNDSVGVAAARLFKLFAYDQVSNLTILGSIPFATTKTIYKKLGDLLAAATGADAKGKVAIASGFKKFVATDITLGEIDGNAVFQAEMLFGAMPGVLADNRVSAAFAGVSVDLDAYAQVVTSTTPDWLARTLAYLAQQARPAILDEASARQWVDFQVRLIDFVGSETASIGRSDPRLRSTAAVALDDFTLIYFAQGLANAYSERTRKYADAKSKAIFGNTTVDFANYDLLHDALKEAAGDSKYSGIKFYLDRALASVESDGEVIIISPGNGQNPFDQLASSPNPSVVNTGAIKEGQVKTFTLFVPYEAQAGGQRIALTLQGSAASTFKVLDHADEVSVAADGKFNLLIKEGDRSVTFGLWAKGDVDVDQTLALSATLVDAAGVATHKTHLELNLALDAHDEGGAPTIPLNGTANADQIFVPAGTGADPSARIVTGSAGNDLVSGGLGNDTVDGGVGNDYVLGFKGDDRLLGGDGNDFIVLGAGTDHAQGGIGDDFFGYWGFDITPLAVYGVGGWPSWFGPEFQWYATINQSQTTGNLELADVILGAKVVSMPVIGHSTGPVRLSLPNYAVDPGNRDSHTVFGGIGNDMAIAGPGADTLLGDDGNDTLLGMRGDDSIFGGLGNDRLAGNIGNDYLDGGAGDDTLDGEDGDDTLMGGAGSDVLRGDVHLASAPPTNHGADYLDGGDGNDTLIGYGGTDTLFGGEGADVLHGDSDLVALAFQSADHLDGEGGNDFLYGYGGDDELFGGSGLDELQGGVGDDYLDGEGDDDLLFGEAGEDDLLGGTGNDRLFGGADADYLDGEEGADKLWGDAGTDKLFGGAGDDMLDGGTEDDVLHGGAGLDELYGGAGDDKLYGGEAADVLSGGEGNDLLAGGPGVDRLYGGSGNDMYVLSDGDGADTIEDFEGTNRIRFANAFSPAEFRVRPGTSETDVVIEYGIAGDSVTVAGGLVGAIREFEFADGTLLTHAQLLDRLPKLPINGTAGADFLSSNYASAILDGGSGDDQIYGSERDDLLRGGADADYLFGKGGADVLDGGTGDDTLAGGPGNDIYLFGQGSGRDVITTDWWSASAGGELDTVVLGPGVVPNAVTLKYDPSQGSPVLTLSNGVDQLVLQNWYSEAAAESFAEPASKFTIAKIRFENGTVWDTSAIAAKLNTGTSGNDRMVGIDTDEVLYGLAGDDWIPGNAGDDVLYGDGGFDELSGGSGADVLVGGADSDRLMGDEGSDVLDGGAGADSLYGGVGDDVFVFGRGYGVDTIEDAANPQQLDTVAFGPGIRPEDISVTVHNANGSIRLGIRGMPDSVLMHAGSAFDAPAIDQYVFENGVTWTAADVRQRLVATAGTTAWDTIYGTAGADVINAGDGYDSVYAGAGDDLIDGGRDGDSLFGGPGSDTYVFARGSGGDQIYDANESRHPGTGAGLNTIKLAAGISPADVSLSLAYSSLQIAINGTNDVLSVSEWFDQEDYRGTLRMTFADGTVWDAATIARRTAPNALQPGLRWGTPDADSISGNDQADYISAAAGDDRVDGGGGNDSLRGGTGKDVLNAGPGNDTLDGGPDNDILNGGAGDDFMNGGAGDDTYLFGKGAGRDRIVESYGFGNLPAAEVIQIDAGILPQDVTRSMLGGEHTLRLASGDSVTVQGKGFQVRFANATTWYLDANPAGPVAGTAAADQLFGTNFDDIIRGYAGNDSLFGGAGTDSLYGGDGNDSLTAGSYYDYAAADLLDGGPGDDVLYHGPGATIVFGHGYGRDEAFVAGRGAVSFNADVTPDQVMLAGLWQGPYGPASLRITFTNSTDSLHLQNWFRVDQPEGTLDEFRFANGTRWDLAQITARIQRTGTAAQDYLLGTAAADALSGAGAADALHGLAGNDTLAGGDGDDAVFGGAGDDRLSGDAGSDQLDGGIGNDVVIGGAGDDNLIETEGNDAYLFSRGFGRDTLSVSSLESSAAWGHDRIEFDATIKPGDVVVTAENLHWDGVHHDLRLAIVGTSNALTISEGMAPASRFIEEVRFAGGTVWTLADLVAKASPATTDGELIDGTAYADTFNALGGNDRINGYAGNDNLYGGAGDDRLSGDAGNDVLDGGAGDDRLYGVTGSDTLRGREGSDLLNGGFGDDSLDGGTGADRMLGGPGNDTYFVDDVHDVVSEIAGGGVDVVRSDVSFALGTDLEHLVLTGVGATSGTGNAGDNLLTGNSAGNALTGGAGNDTLDGAGGVDTMAGGIGNDTYLVDHAADVVSEKANEGVDVVLSSASFALLENVENLTLTGAAAVNATGNTLNNSLKGNSAANVLNGGGGVDAMAGGAGDDTYVVDIAGDVVSENANEGIDTVQSSVTYALGANLERLTLTGSAAIGGTGNSADNVLVGNSAGNVLSGGAGNDRLDGAGGADRLEGGAGNDVYVVGDAGDVVIEKLNEGTDTVESAIAYTLGANVENLTLTGALAINGTGNALNNVLTGNAATNMLSGGAGNDTYVVGASDVVAESANEGVDTILSAFTYTLGIYVENLSLTGTGVISGTGNASDNALTGNAAANILSGGAGNDLLDGGAGIDRLIGGPGNDTYVLDTSADVVVENPNEGSDTVQVSFTYVLGAEVEALTLTGTAAINATGNTLGNVLTGNSAANVLNGAAGIDTLIGGAGNDTYIVDSAADLVSEKAGEGTDSVQSAVTHTLAANVENLTLTGTAAINAIGNGLDNVLTGNAATNTLSGGAGNDTYVIDNTGDVIVEGANAGLDTVQSSVTYVLGTYVENLTLTGPAAINGTGNALDNTITGNSAGNVLLGGGGNDTLNGGAGADALRGEIGNDTYIVDNAADVVTENAGEGTDAVLSAVTHTLAANVENLTLTGVLVIDGTGNASDNVMVGNGANNRLSGAAGNDTLDGGAGADIMIGGLANDAYVVDQAGDTVTESLNEGTDTVETGLSYALGAHVENLILTGTAAANGTGNELGNVLRGNAAANVLNGAAGADSMAGGAGNDTYVVDNTGDAVTENLNEGADTVQSAVTYTLGANVENLTLTGTVAINGTGNALDNILTGNAAANTLAGGGGHDTYVVDHAADLVIESAGNGTDTVRSALTYALSAHVENLILVGTAAISGTGNELSNVIIGNAAANALAGGIGDDLLDGGAGGDALRGGIGSDRYIVDSAADVVIENINEGSDRVESAVTYTLGANVENLTLTGAAALDATGNVLDNALNGNSGNNTLRGEAGNDVLNGGAGADTLIGATGNDTYVIDAADVVIEKPNEGTDIVQAAVTYALTANVENLTLTGNAGIDGIGNTLDNVLTGNAGYNLLDGGAGNDALNGGAGPDFLAGGSGDDTYIVDTAADVISERPGEGTDTVFAPVSLTLPDNVERLTLTGTAGTNATGNALDNVLTGNVSANVLNGAQGADTMIGGAGNDTYRVDHALDVIRENANEGTDVVEANVSHTLGSNVENLVLLTEGGRINGTGNALDNVLTGNWSSNILAGGAGNDTYVINLPDVVIEKANEGNDWVHTAYSHVLDANIENVRLTGGSWSDWDGLKAQYIRLYGQAEWDRNYRIDGSGQVIVYSLDQRWRLSYIDAIGNAGDNVLLGAAENNWLDGGAGNDRLQGGAGADRLFGGPGNDVLDGGEGADTFVGGPGDDTYFMDAADYHPGNTWMFDNWGLSHPLDIAEGPNQGIDTIVTADSRWLPSEFENLTLTGTAPVDGTGNLSHNVVFGNAASNRLLGEDGNDTLRGGAGNDLLNGGRGNDALFGDADNDVLEGADGDDTLSDVAGNNMLHGGAGADSLTGGVGRELFIGGKSNDTIAAGTGADIMAFNRGDGQDVVSATVGADNTLSLGGGIGYADMTFTKSINNLVLNLGAGDQITLNDWYTAPANKSVLNMQVIAEAMADFNATSTDKLRNKKIANFDFLGLAAAYDAAGAPANWALTNALLSKHLSGSDTAALGADLAYRYGRTGTLSGMGFDAVQGMLASGSFGTAAQALQPAATLDTGLRRLS